MAGSSKTNRPQVIGNNVALYRDAYYQVGGGRDARFLENDRKITELAYEGYEKRSPACRKYVTGSTVGRPGAILYGISDLASELLGHPAADRHAEPDLYGII